MKTPTILFAAALIVIALRPVLAPAQSAEWLQHPVGRGIPWELRQGNAVDVRIFVFRRGRDAGRLF